VGELFEELLSIKQQDNVSQKYLADLRNKLGILSNVSFDSFLIRSASRVAGQKGNTSRLCAEQQKGSNARPVLGDWLLWCILTG